MKLLTSNESIGPPQNESKHPYWRSSLLWIPIFVSIAILIMVDMIEINSYNYYTTPLQRTRPPSKQDHYTINQAGCRIPFMKPFDPSITKYIFEPKPINCLPKYPVLSTQGIDHVHLLATEFERQNMSLSTVRCCYRPFWRRRPKDDERDNKHERSQICIPFTTSTKIYDEFVIIECMNNTGSLIYQDTYSFVPDYKVEPKVRTRKQTERQDYVSVLVIGVDAVSRMNLHRQMPRTVQYLKELNAIEMLGYNKIGDNTYPNLMAVLTGNTDQEIQKSYLDNTPNERFDNCPFVWNHFNDRGYATGYAEDSTGMGLFNYVRKGFFNTSVDYDYRVFDQVAEKLIGHTHVMNSKLCLGGRLRIQVLLDYIQRFATVFSDRPFFSFNWGVSMSHDYLNNPSLVDEAHENLFRQLYENQLMNRTIVIFMSDHGIRWGDIRSTYQGRLEERLPFLFFLVPDWFRDKYQSAWANLLQNVNRLTTPLDLHETLYDLSDLRTLRQYDIRARTLKQQKNATRGVSLFLPVSKDRTCQSAGIEEHWCTCQIFEQVDVKIPIVRDVASFVVKQINAQLVGYKECAELELSVIKSASRGEVTHLQDKDSHKNVFEYTLVLSTQPGNGLFEATVRISSKAKNETTFALAGPVSRINLYGAQSRCIADFHLKLYCYCT